MLSVAQVYVMSKKRVSSTIFLCFKQHIRICYKSVSPLHNLGQVKLNYFISVQFSSVAQLCPTLCSLMDCSMPGFPVLHQLPELAQTYVHRVNDAIQPFHLLSSPSPPTFNLFYHQGLFQESVLHIRWPKY